jgi:hypothetical protein
MDGVLKMFSQCNADTVSIPIDTLNYLISIEEDLTR